MKKFIALHNDENGQDLIEYALVTAIVSLSAVVAMNALASEISTLFGSTNPGPDSINGRLWMAIMNAQN
jgi:pilus assembly protein Flp/PilA